VLRLGFGSCWESAGGLVSGDEHSCRDRGCCDGPKLRAIWDGFAVGSLGGVSLLQGLLRSLGVTQGSARSSLLPGLLYFGPSALFRMGRLT